MNESHRYKYTPYTKDNFYRSVPLVKKLIHQYHCKSGWEKTHEGFEAFATELKLITWKTSRRVVIVLRRLGKKHAQAPGNALPHQLSLVEPAEDLSAFEYSVVHKV